MSDEGRSKPEGSSGEPQSKKPWQSPQLYVEKTEVTRGGAFGVNDQDDLFYVVS